MTKTKVNLVFAITVTFYLLQNRPERSVRKLVGGGNDDDLKIYLRENCFSLQIIVNWLLAMLTNVFDICEISRFSHISPMALI